MSSFALLRWCWPSAHRREQAAGGVSAEGERRLRVDGPDADSFGRGEGSPDLQGPRVRAPRWCIGTLAHFDELLLLTNRRGPRGTPQPPWPRRGGARDQLHVQRAAPSGSISISTSTR